MITFGSSARLAAFSAMVAQTACFGSPVVTTSAPIPPPVSTVPRAAPPQVTTPPTIPLSPAPSLATPEERLARYTTVRLQPDTTRLTGHERQMLPLLVDAAREMHAIYWEQSIGPRDSVMRAISDAASRALADVNVGPWDRLDNNVPFVVGVGPKPAGANFYPRDMTKEEFDRAVAGGGARADSLKSLYTMVRRDAAGRLMTVPYARFFGGANTRACCVGGSTAYSGSTCTGGGASGALPAAAIETPCGRHNSTMANGAC